MWSRLNQLWTIDVWTNRRSEKVSASERRWTTIRMARKRRRQKETCKEKKVRNPRR